MTKKKETESIMNNEPLTEGEEEYYRRWGELFDTLLLELG